ncbi:hypothetical protein L345_08999, partial [Ophiophagus hannah]
MYHSRRAQHSGRPLGWQPFILSDSQPPTTPALQRPTGSLFPDRYEFFRATAARSPGTAPP